MAAKPKRRIDFSKLGWRKKSPGAPEKRYARNGRVLRLVRYTDKNRWNTKPATPYSSTPVMATNTKQ